MNPRARYLAAEILGPVVVLAYVVLMVGVVYVAAGWVA